MIPGKQYSVSDVLRIAWHRGWIVLLSFVAVSASTFLVVRRLPNRYRSETMILVVPQRVPESYVKSTVTERIEDRLKSISQQILSRTRLERVIQDFHLYTDEKKAMAMEDVLDRMRDDIVVETVKGDAFRVSYTSRDARTAMKVTERLASMFIEENLRDREVQAEGTDQFLESQLEGARQHLAEDEKKLEEYRKRHGNELPSQMPSNLQNMQNTQAQMQAIGESINRDRDQKLLFQRLIEDAETVDVAAPSDPGARGSDDSAAAQLESARKELRALQLTLKPEHPDVVRMQSTIRDLEKKAAADANNPKPKAPPAPLSPVDAARKSRIRETKIQIDALDRRIAEKEADQKRLEENMHVYQRRIEGVPTRESELAELTRDYDTLQKTYATLLAKKEESKMAANLERRQIGEQFKILDEARMPEKPVSPNRPLAYGAGAAAGLGLGLVIVGFLEYLDTTLKTEEDVIQSLSLPVLALIPFMSTNLDRVRRKRRRIVLISCTAAVTLLAAAAAAAWRLGAVRWMH